MPLRVRLKLIGERYEVNQVCGIWRKHYKNKGHVSISWYNNIFTIFWEQKGTIAKRSRRRTRGGDSAVVSKDWLMSDSVNTYKYFNLS